MQTQGRQSILRRLRSVEGHVRGIQRMVEDDAYCLDVIRQTRAVQRAMHRINVLLLEKHLRGYVATALRADNATKREQVVGELLDVFESLAIS